VLTNAETRKEYDFLRYNQEAYFQKYGSSVLWTYAPKSDVTFIVLILVGAVNAFSWYAQKTKWQNVANRLIKAAAEDWSPSQGGSPESKELRDHALAILAEREQLTAANNNNETTTSPTLVKAESNVSNGDDSKSGKKPKTKGKAKLSGKEKKKQELDALLPILTELVDEMHDFGAGFHKPSWKDLMIVGVAMLPYKLTVGLVWETKYYWNRIQGKELTDEEKEVLTARHVGPVAWDIASEEARLEMIQRELWVRDNLLAWKEEQEIKNLSSREQKMIRKEQKAEKKKGAKQL
jgi:DnaJ homolog subfamily C member 25